MNCEHMKYRALSSRKVAHIRTKHECIGCLKTFPKGSEMIHASIYPVGTRERSLESVFICTDCQNHEYYKKMLGN